MSEEVGSEELLEQMEEIAQLVKEHLLPAMVKSQLIAVERHKVADGEGADNFLFATDSWRLMKNHFFRTVDEAKANEEGDDCPFEKKATHGLLYGNIELRWHRVGEETPGDSDQLGVPKSQCRAARQVINQLELFEKGDEKFDPREQANPSGNVVVIAYTASKCQGLTGVYLAVVGEVDRDKELVLDWQDTLTIWERSEEDKDLHQPSNPITPARSFNLEEVMEFEDPKEVPRSYDLDSAIKTVPSNSDKEESPKGS